jgi:hypothetical protein
MIVVTALTMVDLEGPRETLPPQVSARLARWKREAGEGTAKAKESAGRARKTAEARMVVDSAMNCKRVIYR